MAVFTVQNRGQIRRSIGMGLGLLDQSGGSATLQVTGTSSTSSWAVAALTFGASNEHRGKWAIATDGSSNASSNVGFIRLVTGSTSGRLRFVTAWPVAGDTSQVFELWDQNANPVMVHDFINQAIIDASRKGAVPEETFSIHTGGGLQAFTLPSGSSFTGLEEIEYRATWEGKSLVSFDTAMSSEASVTAETDSADKREGAASARINIGSGISSAAAVATSSFSAIDARPYTHLEFWAKANITTTSSSLRARLGEGSTARETLNIPAMSARTWAYHRIALANPELDSAITRFVLMTGASDAGSATVWLDDAKLVRDATEKWERVNPRFWAADPVNRAIVFEDDATIPYSLLKVRGRRAPNTLTADSVNAEVDPLYIVSHVKANILRSKSTFFAGKPDAALAQAEVFEKDATRRLVAMQGPQQVRWLNNS